MLYEPFLFLYITEKCQLRCKHCYMGDRLERELFMSVEMVDSILRTCRTLHSQYKVYLLGGEPTLHPKFEELIEVCRNNGYKVVVTSNGLIPERKWNILQTNLVDSLSFSLDGPNAETHDYMRGKNSFRQLETSLTKATALGIQTRVIYTVTRHNVGQALKAIEFAEKKRISMISFHYFTPTGLGKDKPDLQLAPAEWNRFVDDLKSESEQRDIQIYYPPAFVTKDELNKLREVGYRGCTARNLERLAIFPDGRVYICSMFFDTDLHYGHFKDGQLQPVARGNIPGELELVSTVGENCRSCPNATKCQAGCAAYDHFGSTYPTRECDRELIPICPLWSTAATPSKTTRSLTELR